MRYDFPMPFGSRSAVMHLDPRDAANAMYSSNRRLQSFEAVSEHRFMSRTASARIGDMSLLAHVSSPCHFEFEEAEGAYLVVPFSGSGRIQLNSEQYDIKAGSTAAILPNRRRTFQRDYGSCVVVYINENQIYQIIQNNSPKIVDTLKFEQAKLIDVSKTNNRFSSFSAICKLIESQFGNQDALGVLGVDDLINRWVAWCFLPPGDDPALRIERARIDVVCDLVRASVDRPLTLTEMEDVSGLSARALQYAFKARFGCSPMQWQRNERLLGAMQRILSMAPGETITTIAHSMGFSSSSAFTALYRHQFGETPSDTVLRNR